jgi:hypothetical protein
LDSAKDLNSALRNNNFKVSGNAGRIFEQKTCAGQPAEIELSPDGHDDQCAFEDKQGVQTILSQGELRASFGITPQLAACDYQTGEPQALKAGKCQMRT